MNRIVTVEFRQDTIFAVEREDGVFIAVTPICERLGVLPQKQRERIMRDPILREGVATMATPSPGGQQEMFCLRLDLVNGWLFTIDESRVKDEETRQRVLTYKRECYQVLFEHFHGAAKGQSAQDAARPQLMPGDAGFGEAVRFVREVRLSKGRAASLSMIRALGLPWIPEMGDAPDVGLTNPEEDDAVARFAREGVEKAPGIVTPAAAFESAFDRYCSEMKLRHPGKGSFQSRFGRMGFSKRKVAGRMVYYGVRPVSAAQELVQ